MSLVCGVACSAVALDHAALDVQVPSGKTRTAASAAHSTKAKHWFEVGVASWYGEHFQGRKTSTGETFDMNALTCAHPTLPMGTWLRVTNMKNHRTTFVRVNDRGPLVEGRIIDLSFAAAQAVGLSGIGRVKLETVREGDTDMGLLLVAQLGVPALLPLSSR